MDKSRRWYCRTTLIGFEVLFPGNLQAAPCQNLPYGMKAAAKGRWASYWAKGCLMCWNGTVVAWQPGAVGLVRAGRTHRQCPDDFAKMLLSDNEAADEMFKTEGCIYVARVRRGIWRRQGRMASSRLRLRSWSRSKNE